MASPRSPPRSSKRSSARSPSPEGRPLTLDVRLLDPADEQQLRAWWEIGRASQADRPQDLWKPWEVSRLSWVEPAPQHRNVFVAAYDGDRMVGSGLLDLHEIENTHLSFLVLHVAPPERRRGIGSALLADLEDRSRAVGRLTVMADANLPLDGDSPGSRFAAARGYAVANLDTIKTADLAATAASWPALEERAAERLDGYRLDSWLGPAPEDRIDGLAALYSRFLGEIPLGDLDLQPQRFDRDRIRTSEARWERTGRAHLTVVALDPGGVPVGYTDLEVAPAAPRVASIHSTLVLPEHRGHRLGLAMKVRLHQHLHAAFPDTELIVTGNADVNSHMNAVNELLGYEPFDRLQELQKRI